MSVDLPDPGTSGPSRVLGSTAAVEAPQASERRRVADAARQFEAMFLLQMLKQMRQSMLDEEGSEQGLGASTMFDTIDAELAQELATQGTGLAPVLIDGLSRTSKDDGAPGGAGFAMPLAPAGQTGTVSSAFGWRRDPLNGSRRFHAGVDLRGAYGTPVAAAAAGRVVFAGVQGGYGQSIVVEHAPGLQTRYAHLSEIGVREGEVVGAGAQLGRVGASGRATGPHLHFEVLADGRRVDPVSGASHLTAALKLQRENADSPTGTPGTANGTPGADE